MAAGSGNAAVHQNPRPPGGSILEPRLGGCDGQDLALDESNRSQPLLDRTVNAKPSRCAGMDAPETAMERLRETVAKR